VKSILDVLTEVHLKETSHLCNSVEMRHPYVKTNEFHILLVTIGLYELCGY
jgi:hypothetical protein